MEKYYLYRCFYKSSFLCCQDFPLYIWNDCRKRKLLLLKEYPLFNKILDYSNCSLAPSMPNKLCIFFP